VEDQLLLTLCYWREFCRTIQKVEKALLDDQRFHLPGKKALWERESDFLELVVVVVDASEQRIERPCAQKNSVSTTLARKNATRKKDKS
jgi:hypothetical protein